MNFRSDRVREITKVLTQGKQTPFGQTEDFVKTTTLEMHPLQLYYVCTSMYDETFQNMQILFPKENVTNTLGEIIANTGKTQLHIAETEKYPHVTFFFA